MDSKQLFRLYNSKFYLTNWLDKSGNMAQEQGQEEWYYCGVDKDYKEDVVRQAINNTFADDEVYLCISPKQSSLVSKTIVAEEIGKMLHKKEIGVMDKSLTTIMHFSQYGVFESGIIREFPKSRPRPDGTPLRVGFHANVIEPATRKVHGIVSKYLDSLANELHKDYGGSMEHLWIDLELVERNKPWPFRFQKRVDNPSSHTEFYSYNVGHYSVRPDFEKLRELSSEESICSYIFGLIYDSTQVLVDKQKKLGGFDAAKFRSDLLTACNKVVGVSL